MATHRLFLLMLLFSSFLYARSCPLPEHPRPDFERESWVNLNGLWSFEFDAENRGIAEQWYLGEKSFSRQINVPFPWGSPLSGVSDEAVIGWYQREVQIPEKWRGERIYLIVGAADWQTTGWLGEREIGSFQGGYTPFEFEITDAIQWGEEQRITLRIDDTEHKFKLYGKQGYGNARGIWQTVYLEARPAHFITNLHFYPDIDNERVMVKGNLNAELADAGYIALKVKDQSAADFRHDLKKGQRSFEFTMDILNCRLWSLEDPYLYELTAELSTKGEPDVVSTYFGMRKISVLPFPNQEYTYIALNNKPIYLQLTLDQAYHPEGYYTFPSDEFMRDEILLSRRIGLNGQRIHVKIENPRKLYWADKLGFLIMADLPNSWGEPDENMRREARSTLEAMINRDFNHPSIFSWILFNETWGLFSGDGAEREYRKETQDWVEEMYFHTKKMDPTRLVEDNSACNYDHVETDINSWHAYLPGYGWRDFLSNASAKTFKHSSWNFVKGKSQKKQPNLNSECGNVWGYKGSTGDIDWSWDYHKMINEFRRFPTICGWLYTEHHDVINEWNGYYRYDRSNKHTGLEELLPGMSLRDLHSPFYVSTGQEICREASPGEVMAVPIYVSFLTDENVGETLFLQLDLYGWDDLGVKETYSQQKLSLPFKPWTSREYEPVTVTMPEKNAVVILGMTLSNAAGTVLQRNFTTFVVSAGAGLRQESRLLNNQKALLLRFAPQTFADAAWSLKQWDVYSGLKVNGAGAGYFEYRLKWPDGIQYDQVKSATIRFEASAKQLFGKDRGAEMSGDYMLGKGTVDPSANPNSYPMTDEQLYPSAVAIRVNGHIAAVVDLPDDPADHRGILSWHEQKRDGTLHEAGSYGYLVEAILPQEGLRNAAETGELVIRFEVDDALPGGLALYGERFGRYMMDPTLIFNLK